MDDVPQEEFQIKKGWCSYPDVSLPLGGDFILTNRHLIFVPFAYHVRASRIQLPLESIQRVGTTRIKLGLGITRKGLLVGCADHVYRFIVKELPVWEKLVTEAVTTAHGGPQVPSTDVSVPVSSADLTRPSSGNIISSILAIALVIPIGFVLMYMAFRFIINLAPQLAFELRSMGIDPDTFPAVAGGIGMALSLIFSLALTLLARNK
ncbi:MAG: hypothetical protein H8D43_01095 [Chloroflexi bacterium]|nr:hypothetical protein [Chloroflexota bacterium]